MQLYGIRVGIQNFSVWSVSESDTAFRKSLFCKILHCLCVLVEQVEHRNFRVWSYWKWMLNLLKGREV